MGKFIVKCLLLLCISSQIAVGSRKELEEEFKKLKSEIQGFESKNNKLENKILEVEMKIEKKSNQEQKIEKMKNDLVEREKVLQGNEYLIPKSENYIWQIKNALFESNLKKNKMVTKRNELKKQVEKQNLEFVEQQEKKQTDFENFMYSIKTRITDEEELNEKLRRELDETQCLKKDLEIKQKKISEKLNELLSKEEEQRKKYLEEKIKHLSEEKEKHRKQLSEEKEKHRLLIKEAVEKSEPKLVKPIQKKTDKRTRQDSLQHCADAALNQCLGRHGVRLVSDSGSYNGEIFAALFALLKQKKYLKIDTLKQWRFDTPEYHYLFALIYSLHQRYAFEADTDLTKLNDYFFKKKNDAMFTELKKQCEEFVTKNYRIEKKY